MSTTNQNEIKEKASKIISGIFNLTEKGVHAIIDKGNTLTHTIDKKVSDTYDSLVKNLEKFIDEFEEKDIDKLTPGELVISPVDIVVFDKVQHRAGEIFRFDEKIIPFVKAKLYKPNEETIERWARKTELEKILPHLTQSQDIQMVKNLMSAYETKK